MLADTPMAEFISTTSGEWVEVASPDAATLAALLARPGVTVTAGERGALDVRGLPASTIGELASSHGVVLHQLATRRLSLEDAFMKLTNETVDYHGTDGRSER